MTLAASITAQLRDHRANPLTVNGYLLSRSDAIELLRIERMATVRGVG